MEARTVLKSLCMKAMGMEPLTLSVDSTSCRCLWCQIPTGMSEAIHSACWIKHLVNPALVKYNICIGDGRWPPRDAWKRMEARTVLKSLGIKAISVTRSYGDSVCWQYFMLVSLTSNTQLEWMKQFALLARSSIWSTQYLYSTMNAQVRKALKKIGRYWWRS